MNWLCPCLARRHKADHERDPLLPRAKNTSRLSNDDDDPERRLDNHLLAALAALRAHKLPDTHQLLRILDTCGSTSGRGVKGDVGRAAGALGRVLGEENADDLIQELIHQCTLLETSDVCVEVDVLVDTSDPSTQTLSPTTTAALLTAVRTLLLRFLASAALRAALKTLLNLLGMDDVARAAGVAGEIAGQTVEMAQDVVSAVGQVADAAGQVMGVAQDVVGVAANVGEVAEDVGDVAGDVGGAAQPLGGVTAQLTGVLHTVENVQETATDLQSTLQDGANTVIAGAAALQDLAHVGERLQDEKQAQVDDMRKREEERMHEDEEDPRDVVVARVQEIFAQIHHDPPAARALAVIVDIMRKHPGFALDIKLDPKLASILGLVRRLVERCAASSPDTMADLTAALRAVLGDLPAERILAFLARALAVPGPGTKSTRAAQDARRHTAAPQGKRTEPLAGPAYVASPQGARAVGALYDEVVAIYGEGAAIYSGVDANAPLDANALHGESGGVNVGNNANATSESTKAAARLHTLRTRAAHFAHALATDRALVDLVQSLTALAHDLADLSTDIASGNWQTRLARTSQSNLADVVAWLLPRLLRVLPMPRAELRTPTLDAALDSLFATADGAGVSPDCVVVRNWSEVRVDMGGSGLDSAQGDEGEEGYGGGGVEGESGDERGGTRVHTTHRIHIHVDGVRLAARGVAYYVAYKGLVPYTDEGLLSVDVGPGASVDVEIGLDSSSTSHIPSTTSSSPENENENDEEPEPAHPLYTVHAVHVSLPALAVRIRRSRHWLLNALLVQPLAAPVVRRVLAAQVRSALEGGARVGGEVVREAHAHETSASGDRNGDKEGDGAGDGRVGWWDYWTAALKVLGGGEGEDEVKTESRTEAHLNGVTHVVEAEGGEETVLALGMGAQILPGKGGPHGDEGPPTLGDVVDEAAEEVIRGVGEAVDVAERVHVREFVEHAGERLEERTLAEDGRAGWRSAAFDF